MWIVFMSACLQVYHHRLLNKLGSEVKILGKQAPLRKPFSFSKLNCHQFLHKTSSPYILSDSYTSKSMLGTKKKT